MDKTKAIEGQSKKLSAIETITSTIVGYIIAVVLFKFLMPLFGFSTSWNQSYILTFIFAIASILRGYFIRRFFNSIENFQQKTTV